MKIIIFGVLILLIIYYFYYFNKESLEVHENFISSSKFDGAKEGYVFKNCSKGLGYYIDKMN